MSAESKERLEPWAWGAFALAGAAAGLFLYLGMRPGGDGPILAYRYGLLALGWASAVGMLLALLWSLRRRPVLGRRRALPLSALGATLWMCSLPIAYPSSHEGKFSTTRFRLPFEGAARVRYGGEPGPDNPLVFDPARRFGVGFVPDGSDSLEVVAPAAGTLRATGRGRGGLWVLLEIRAEESVVLEGLEEGSCTLEVGARVAEGERLGRASGILLVHLQDRPEAGTGEGVPMRFWGYRADGRRAESGIPVPPQVVEAEHEGR